MRARGSGMQRRNVRFVPLSEFLVAAIRSRANRFLIIRESSSFQIAAYIMMRIMVDPDDDSSVVYV